MCAASIKGDYQNNIYEQTTNVTTTETEKERRETAEAERQLRECFSNPIQIPNNSPDGILGTLFGKVENLENYQDKPGIKELISGFINKFQQIYYRNTESTTQTNSEAATNIPQNISSDTQINITEPQNSSDEMLNIEDKVANNHELSQEEIDKYLNDVDNFIAENNKGFQINAKNTQKTVAKEISQERLTELQAKAEKGELSETDIAEMTASMNFLEERKNVTLEKINETSKNLSNEDILKAMDYVKSHQSNLDFNSVDFRHLPQHIQNYIKSHFEKAQAQINQNNSANVSPTEETAF